MRERTLYDRFATKATLFEHVVEVAIVGDEEPVALAARPRFREALAEQDRERAASLYARYSAEVLERAAPLITVAIESSGADAALREFSDRGAEATRANCRAFVDALAGHGLLGKQDRDQVAMAAYALVAPLVHQHLRRDLGWSARRYHRWLEASLRALLQP